DALSVDHPLDFAVVGHRRRRFRAGIEVEHEVTEERFGSLGDRRVLPQIDGPPNPEGNLGPAAPQRDRMDIAPRDAGHLYAALLAEARGVSKIGVDVQRLAGRKTAFLGEGEEEPGEGRCDEDQQTYPKGGQKLFQKERTPRPLCSPTLAVWPTPATISPAVLSHISQTSWRGSA